MWRNIDSSSSELLKWRCMKNGLLAAAGCVIAVRWLYLAWIKYSVRQRISRKQKILANSRDAVRNKLIEERVDKDDSNAITSLTFNQLTQKLQNGELKAINVLRAYQMKALEVTEKLNCVVEFIKEAEDYARECDQLPEAERRKRPLHGVPVSIKENFCIKGYDSTAGMSIFLNQPWSESCVIVKVLIKLGAVPFARTNIPQTMLSFACSNPIYGVTKNPHDPTRGPGGSSGGEGALIGGGGSILGIGSDIGGSIRIPAHLCGIAGFKPTSFRVSATGKFPLLVGENIVYGSSGPMARDVDALVAFLKGAFGPLMNEDDALITPLAFQSQLYESTRPLCVGYYTCIGGLHPVPACTRALLKVKDALESQGHTLIEFKPPRVLETLPFYISAVFGDRGQELRNHLKKDIVDPCFKLPNRTINKPVLQWTLSKIVKFFFRDPVLAYLIAPPECRSIFDWWTLQSKVENYKQEFIAEWRCQGLDLLICPGFGTTAVPSGTEYQVNTAMLYTILFNLLNFPAGSLPVTRVSPQDESDLQDPVKYPAHSFSEKLFKKLGHGSTGLPVNVQCAGLPFQDELVLRLMKEIENVMISL